MQTVPLDFLGELRRTNTCGELRAKDSGSRALLMGWVHRRRDLGGVIFIHLRDRDGVTQIVFHTDADAEVHAKAELLRSEYVIAVEGKVEQRSADTINPNLATGEPACRTPFRLRQQAVGASFLSVAVERRRFDSDGGSQRTRRNINGRVAPPAADGRPLRCTRIAISNSIGLS